MKTIRIKDLSQLTDATLVNAELLKRRSVTGVSTDSRTVQPDSLFFALKGETFDAHNYIDDVVKARVSAVVVERSWAESNSAYFRTFPCTFVVVEDTTKALGELARIYRRRFDIPVIAVAGSNGKTTTKELITSVLGTKYTVLSTEGNFNNHIGVPHTLFRLTARHDAAVIELGTNHFGELKYLCGIAEPTHGLITNIGKEHLEFFENEEGVAKEERELFTYLAEHNGFAFINGDDPYLAKDNELLHHSLIYGVQSEAEIRAKNIAVDAMGRSSFTVAWHTNTVTFDVRLSVPGSHHVSNALAAIAVGLTLNVKPKKIVTAVEKFVSASKRMEVISGEGITVLNDTYNSNPDSVIAALKTLQSFATDGRKIVVLGDMKELGDASKREHTNIGVLASEMGFDVLYTYGSYSKYTGEAFGHKAFHFESKTELTDELSRSLAFGDVVLVKGSRGMKMEDVVNRLMNINALLETAEAR